jgi:hypothetical protein
VSRRPCCDTEEPWRIVLLVDRFRRPTRLVAPYSASHRVALWPLELRTRELWELARVREAARQARLHVHTQGDGLPAALGTRGAANALPAAVVEFCAQGTSLAAFAGEIGVSRDCLTKWGKAHPDFFLAVGVAKAAAVLWHEKHGLRIAEYGGAPGQAAMVMFYLRNFAPEEFGESRDSKGDARFASASTTTIRPTMMPQQAADLYMAALRGPIVESAAGSHSRAKARNGVAAVPSSVARARFK